MDTKEIFSEIDSTITEVEQLFSLFTDEEVNSIPFEGSWTAAQLVEHVNLSLSGFIYQLFGPVRDTERQPDAGVQQLRDMFLNFENKFRASPSIYPASKNYKKAELLSTLDELKTKLNSFDTSSDLSKTCVAVELPFFGYLTRTEIAYFIIYHTQRHLHQLQSIYNHIKSHKKTYKNETN
jgi:hypothetical protein